ncbi:hypothetical protein BS78_K209600 [Paspalum vaginatum]|uniref:Uncharacterized protein n=1 Tax=Paspalum vaginatum TaxID=158149 RepID=A0A9W8CD20_9POAL|nr:hypothetical protein BS78_K209600 [Paspalum vaginatum]
MPFPRANQSDPLFSVLPRRRPPDSLAATLPSSPLPKIKSRCRLGLGVGRQQDQNQPSRKINYRLICASGSSVQGCKQLIRCVRWSSNGVLVFYT